MRILFSESGYTVKEYDHNDNRGTVWHVSDPNGIGYSTYFPPPLKLEQIKEEIANHRQEKRMDLDENVQSVDLNQ